MKKETVGGEEKSERKERNGRGEEKSVRKE